MQHAPQSAIGAEPPVIQHPPGEYAIVELFGHTTMVGRVYEVERFGAKMLAIEPLFRDTLLPEVLHGGAAIYRFTPCSAEVAFSQQPRRTYMLPAAVRSLIPPLLLDTPEGSRIVDLDTDVGFKP